MPYNTHLTSSTDLVTTQAATRAGFVYLALEKNRRSTPFIEQARALKSAASEAKTAYDLLSVSGIQVAMLTAAGVSDKALNHLLEQDKTEAVKGLIEYYLVPAGEDFVEELVYRFLLTKGDTLGGAMRNVGGVIGERKLARATISNLSLNKIPYYWLHSSKAVWLPGTGDDADIEIYLKGLSWHNGNGTRTMLYNRQVPFVGAKGTKSKKKGNNVDLCLFDCGYYDFDATIISSPEKYLALGELKGGVDPAGADEHWKTANSALDRIRKAFSSEGMTPHTFFVGAAIQTNMAEEIWGQLQDGTLSNAANLTNPDQVSSLCRWLCNL